MDLDAAGIVSSIIGVDMNRKAAAKAVANLSGIKVGDILTLGSNELSSADVVICSFAALWVTADRRYRIIRRCAEQLKADGVLVTNARLFGRPGRQKPVNSMRYWLSAIPMLSRGWPEFKAEVIECLVELRKTNSVAIREQDEALAYAENIKDSWDALGAFSRFGWYLVLVVQAPSTYARKLVKSATRFLRSN
jgi:SAM-dependent methyltransferase